MNNMYFNPLNRFTNFVSQFNQFRQDIQKNGIDPKQRVQELLNSGQMTQEQFNQLRDTANLLTGRNAPRQ